MLKGSNKNKVFVFQFILRSNLFFLKNKSKLIFPVWIFGEYEYNFLKLMSRLETFPDLYNIPFLNEITLDRSLLLCFLRNFES